MVLICFLLDYHSNQEFVTHKVTAINLALNSYNEAEGKEVLCKVIEDREDPNYAITLSCGDVLYISGSLNNFLNYLKRSEAMNDDPILQAKIDMAENEIEEYQIIKKYRPELLSNLKVKVIYQTHYELFLKSILWSFFASFCLFFFLESILYRSLIYIVFGKKCG